MGIWPHRPPYSKTGSHSRICPPRAQRACVVIMEHSPHTKLQLLRIRSSASSNRYLVSCCGCSTGTEDRSITTRWAATATQVRITPMLRHGLACACSRLRTPQSVPCLDLTAHIEVPNSAVGYPGTDQHTQTSAPGTLTIAYCQWAMSGRITPHSQCNVGARP